ncbi:hypothetical protein LNP17_23850 [Klebsiella variicola subsp. variicola]|nr:hypothetical protein [Klebsiella variicola subsp. variicola]
MLYFIGGFLTALPFLYEGLASPAVIDRINHLSRLQKIEYGELSVCLRDLSGADLPAQTLHHRDCGKNH